MKKALVCSDDATLLIVRAAVLRSVPYEVESVLGVGTLGEIALRCPPALIVLCSSISFDDRVRLEHWAKLMLHEVSVITVTRSGDPTGHRFDHPVSLTDGPAGLVELSKRLTA